ncbi:histidine kinase [Nonomuraea sp. NPDC048881]|uniref:sensor histidine kinase n=1 Tax=Nonomuraea sp. NPDC048881 TaxID=3155030 RepID=UPI0033DC8440
MTSMGRADGVLTLWTARFSGRRGDVAIAAVTTAATLGPLLVPSPKAWWIVALGALASAPVYWRRRAPMAVALLVGAAMTVMVLWEKPFLPFGPLVAVHTIADLSPMWKRLAAIPAIAVIVGFSLALPGEDSEIFRLIGTAFVAAYALGTSARANRSRAAELAERARRREQQHIAAVAEERARIARDMHDIITHAVGLMVVQAEAGPVVVRSDAPRAEAVFDAIADTGRGALTELRGLLTALRASDGPAGEDLGTAQPSLDGLASLADRSGLDVVMTVEGERRRTSGSLEAAVYRIVQEALTNVRKHAGVRNVRLYLRWTARELVVEIADEGGGPRRDGGGYGLTGMRERATAYGGTLTVGPGQDGGFLVRAVFPLE